MGAESSCMLKDFSLGQPYFSSDESAVKVTVYPATNSVEEKKYTVFQYPKDNGKVDEGVSKHLEILRTTRHPHILKNIIVFNDSKKTTLVTEHVIPLDVAIERQEKEEIFVGLYNILEAILFLNERANICHNNVSVSSVFVADNGDWKLAAFENSTKVQRLAKQSYENDIVGYGEFALSVLEYMKDDSLHAQSFMTKLQNHYSEENKNDTRPLKELCSHEFFNFPYMSVLNGLKNLPLSSFSEKQTFFRTLEEKIHGSPPQVVCRKCIPLLFSNLILCDESAQESFMKCLFSSGSKLCLKENGLPLFDQEYFVKYSLPCILDLFDSQDSTIRLMLMKYLPLYIECIDKVVLQEDILPQLLRGLQDVNDKIVSETFLALSQIVPILGGEAVVGCTVTKIFFDRKPDFSRTVNDKGNQLPRSFNDLRHSKKDENTLGDTGFNNAHKKTTKVDRQKMMEEKERQKKEREKQRIDREKLREEQRRKREERKKVREQIKVELKKQSSDEASSEGNETSRSVGQNTVEGTSSKNGSDHSEADWEGFEACSNNGSDDYEEKQTHWGATGVSTASGSNLYTVNKSPTSNQNSRHDDWEDWGKQEEDYENKHQLSTKNRLNSSTNRTSSTTSSDNWNDDWSNEKSPVDNYEQSFSQNITSSKSDDWDNWGDQPSENSQVIKEESSKIPKSKGLNLSGAKKIKTTTASKESKMDKQKDPLGAEYDIQIMTNNVSEPDYFADMTPTYNPSNKVTIEQKPTVSSKFQAATATIDEESGGWGEDDWGDL